MNRYGRRWPWQEPPLSVVADPGMPEGTVMLVGQLTEQERLLVAAGALLYGDALKLIASRSYVLTGVTP